MNINLKKISVSLLASAFLFSVIEMQNVSAFSNDEKEIVLDSNGDETNTTIDEINAIIDLQNEAFVEENFSCVKEYENQMNLSIQNLKCMWEFYILKVILEKIALYQMGKIDLSDPRQKKDGWEKWYNLLNDLNLTQVLFE